MNLVKKEFSFKENKFNIFCILDSIKVAGVQLAQGDHPSHHSFLDEVEIRDYLWNINKGDVVLDVGAQYGSYSLCALACGAEKIYAWSPQDHEYLSEKIILEKSLELNNWQNKSIVYDTGVYSKNGWLNTFTQEFYEQNPHHINSDIIKVSTLNSWYELERQNILSKKVWIKLDVEAAEIEVLKGASKLIKEIEPIIFIENHDCLVEGIGLRTKKLMEDLYNYKEIIKVPYYSRSHSLYRKVSV